MQLFLFLAWLQVFLGKTSQGPTTVSVNFSERAIFVKLFLIRFVFVSNCLFQAVNVIIPSCIGRTLVFLAFNWVLYTTLTTSFPFYSFQIHTYNYNFYQKYEH